jgi:transcription antitermination factor NusG
MPDNIVEFRKPANMVRDRLYILTIEPSQERAACIDLARIGFDAYAPSMRYQRRMRGRYRKFSRPILPGYVFAVASEADDPTIRHAAGVSGILAEIVKEYDRNWVAEMLICESMGAFDATLERKQKLKLGDIVKIIAGKWAALGYAGKVAKIEQRKVSIHVQTQDGKPVRHGMPLSCDAEAVVLVA